MHNLLSVKFDAALKMMEVNVVDSILEKIVRTEQITILANKRVFHRTSLIDTDIDWVNFGLSTKFHNMMEFVMMFASVLRSGSQPYEESIYDPRDAVEWLADQDDFELCLPMGEFEQHAELVFTTMSMFRESDDDSMAGDWTVIHPEKDGVAFQSLPGSTAQTYFIMRM